MMAVLTFWYDIAYILGDSNNSWLNCLNWRSIKTSWAEKSGTIQVHKSQSTIQSFLDFVVTEITDWNVKD